jgi:hypothetical protein
MRGWRCALYMASEISRIAEQSRYKNSAILI